MSRHAFNPTPEQREAVEAMIACGDSEAEICTRIINPATGKPISLKMLRKHFAAEIAPRPVEVDLLINTPLGKESFFDERSIRRAAIHYRIPCITTIPGAIAAVAGIRALQKESLGVRSLQEYHGK